MLERFDILKVNIGSKIKPLKLMELITRPTLCKQRVSFHSYPLLDYQPLILAGALQFGRPHVNNEHLKCGWSKLRCKYKTLDFKNLARKK